MSVASLGYLGHLGRRFVGSLSSSDPPAVDSAWALSQCLPGEQVLWQQMPAADRRHAIGVGRRTESLLGSADRAVLAAALLHDVGKIEAGLGTFGRVGATVVGAGVGRARATGWAGVPGPLGQIGRYLSHGVRGAALLASAGSDPLTVAWAREHHLPASRWTVPVPIGEALKAADDD
jgi:hypothetical protein